MLGSGGELGGMTRGRHLVIGKNIVKGPDDSRLSKTSFLSNRVGGMAMGSQRKDIFLLSRGDGMHDEL